MGTLRESSLACLVLLSLGTAGCGEDPTGSPSPTPDETEPCLLQVDTEIVRWTAVGVGYEAAQTVEFSNEGGEACSVQLSVEGDGFQVEPATLVLNPAGVQMVTLTFGPASVGAAQAKLHVRGGQADRTIALAGEAVASCLSLTPAEVEFASAQPECSSSEADVVVENGCSHPVGIESIETEVGPTNDPANSFGIRHRPASPVAAHGTASIKLVYRPQAIGADADRLVVVEENGAATFAALHGTGAFSTTHTDAFTQYAPWRVDTLFVIDDSAAMAPWAAQIQPLAENMLAFHRSEDVRARWGVTTTSRAATAGCSGSGADGRLVPFDGSGPRWLETDSDRPASDFADLLDVGTCSEAPNEGMAAAVRALTDPLASQADDPAHPEVDDGNAGFLRENIGVNIIFISARDDASGESVDAWHDRLRQVRGVQNDNLLKVHALVAPADSCETATAGTRYTELADRTAGMKVNICDPSWLEALFGEFGSPPFDQSKRFFLTGFPVDGDGDGDLLDELTVSVNGEEVTPTADDGSARWSYDVEENDIVFAPDHQPAEGAQVTVTYTVGCQN